MSVKREVKNNELLMKVGKSVRSTAAAAADRNSHAGNFFSTKRARELQTCVWNGRSASAIIHHHH
jgi:hypothetical protein